MSIPKLLLVATQPFPSAVRLAIRLKRYGADVAALCPVGSNLAHSSGVGHCYPFWALNPLSSLRAAISQSQPDFLIPTDDRAVWFLHELTERNPEYRELVERSIGPSSSFPITRSRARLLSLATSLGIAVPETMEINSNADIALCVQKLSTPFFLKKDGTWAGIGVRIINDSSKAYSSYKRLLRYPSLPIRLKQRLHINDPTAFTKLARIGTADISAQAFIDGVPATAMYACHRGVLLGNVQARVVSSKGKLGAALMIELIQDERIERAGRLLAEALQLSGFFGLDFVLKAGSWEPYLIEMNPRCTQMGHIAVANKPDLAGVLFTQLTGRPVTEVGAADLEPLVYFYPQAIKHDPTSPFLNRARPDVGLEERESIVKIGQGNGTWPTWLRARVRRPISSVRSVLPSKANSLIYYHNAYPVPEHKDNNVQTPTIPIVQEASSLR